MMKQRANLRVLAANGQLYTNTPLGRSVSLNSSSLSHGPVFFSGSSSNFVSPSHQSLKRIKPEPWQRLFEGKKQQQSSIKTRLNHEDFSDVFNESSIVEENSFIPSPIQRHIDQLYEQIDDLMLQLSEERFQHQQTRTKIEHEISKRLKEQERKFQELSQQTFRKHTNHLDEQERRLTEIFNEKQKLDFQREQQLRDELQFIKQSFHLYKLTLDENNCEQMKKPSDGKINENKLHRIQIDNLRRHYENEMTTLQKTLAEKTIDYEKFESMKKELLSNQLELNQTKERSISLSTRLNELENQHSKTIQEFDDCRTRLNEQTKEIEKLRTERVHK